MAVDIKIPEVGESITEGVLVEWSQPDGAIVAVEAPLLVLETDKITMTINAEHSGRLKILVDVEQTVQVGQVVGTIDTEAVGDVSSVSAEDLPAIPAAASAASPATSAPSNLVAVGNESTGASLSPAVHRLMLEHGLEPNEVQGSGKNGRILKGDVLHYLEERARKTEAEPVPAPAISTSPEPTSLSPTAVPVERQSRAPMSRLRRRLADRLVEVQQTAAILTTFNEVDMSRVMDLRKMYKEPFKERHNIGLGFMSFFVKAVVAGLQSVPEVNAFIEGDDLVTNHYFDIGVAVSTEKGLVVPVIRNADKLSMAEIEANITDLAQRAQNRTLELSDLIGAVFTISNGGVFGSLMSTPILNPPGSAILGMHTIQKRPVAVDDEVVIRPMMYLALSYDHRIIDGREAVSFLKRIVECIEDPERMMLEV